MTTRLGVRSAVLAGLTTALLACSGAVADSPVQGNAGAGPVWPDPLPKDQFEEAYANVVCQYASACCVKLGLPLEEGFDCTASMRHAMHEQMSAMGELTGVVYDPERAADCLAILNQSLAQCSTSDWKSIWGPCGGMFAGTRKLGEPCADDNECIGHEMQNVICISQTCRGAPPRMAKGEPCEWTCDIVGWPCTGSENQTPMCWLFDGLYCDEVNKTCVELVDEGQPCHQYQSCVLNAWCDGVCKPFPGVGGDCEHEPKSCGEGLFCDEGICVPASDNGSACTNLEQCRSKRCDYGWCVPQDAVWIHNACAKPAE